MASKNTFGKVKKLKVNIYFVAFVLIVVACAAFLITMGYKKEVRSSDIQLKQIAEGFTAPISLVSPDDSSGRLFVVDQIGIIKIIKNGKVLDEPFLDVRDKMVELNEEYDERGLLGLAFHPNFRNNGRFFVYYSAPLRASAPKSWDHTSHVSEFNVSSDNPDRADKNSERIIIEFDEPQMNHNGGDLVFGPDSYLYISTGDGGNADDVGLGHSSIGNGQDTSTLLGKILRINVNGRKPYTIPSDNPFVNKAGKDEIFAYGFRNPFRMSFSEAGELFVADVGQNLWEEIDVVTKGGNYGWNLKEGTHCFSTETPNESPESCPGIGLKGEALLDPILEYPHANTSEVSGTAIIGGFIYRGQKLKQSCEGSYIFGDWSSSFAEGKAKLFIAQNNKGVWTAKKLKDINGYLHGLGEDENHEIYALITDKLGPSGSGKVFLITKKV